MDGLAFSFSETRKAQRAVATKRTGRSRMRPVGIDALHPAAAALTWGQANVLPASIPPDVKPKLLIIELWGLGDLAIATPFLRKACEQFDVTLLAKPFALDLQPHFWPEVKVIPFNAPWTAFAFRHKYQLFSWPWRMMFSVWKSLFRERFDVALSARWDPRDHFLLNLTGARARMGFPRVGSRMFLTHPLASPDHAAHRYENWLTIARSLNLNLEPRDKLHFPAQLEGKVVLIHTGAAQPVRVWPLERYRVLVEKLRARGETVKVVCNPEQQTWWKNAGETEVAAPQTVSELLQCMEGAGVFLGNDSGPGHLAAVSGIPTFTFFGPQIVEWFVPLHPEAEFMEGKACPYKPCSDYCRYPVPHCLWNITVEEVWPKVGKFVERHLNRDLWKKERATAGTVT
jgi:ADP-heptose:LPS heptosyltransferase